MRTQPLAALVVLLLGGVDSTLAGLETATPVRLALRPTHAALAEKQQLGPAIQGKGVERAKPKEAANPPRKSGPTKNLLARSTVLAHGEYWAIVPKGALIHVPDTFKARVEAEPKKTLLPWKDFYSRNRGWLHPQPVSFSQAAGKSPLSQETLEMHKTLARVVVATLHGGPITLQPARQDSGQQSLATKP